MKGFGQTRVSGWLSSPAFRKKLLQRSAIAVLAFYVVKGTIVTLLLVLGAMSML